jgi:hypothetical protein
MATLLTAVVAGSALAGPPHIRVTLRGHPTAGGFVTLTTFHHGTQQPLELHGTAEGLVDGLRTSVPLRFDAVPEERGVFVVPKTWGNQGVWVLNIGSSAEHGGAGIVIGVDRAGRPEWQITPRTLQNLTRPATAAEVEDLLTALRDGRIPPEMSRADLLAFAARNRGGFAVMALLAAACGAIAWRSWRGMARPRPPVAA